MAPISALLVALCAGFASAQDLDPGDRPGIARALVEVRVERDRASRDDTATLARLEAVVRACLHKDGPKWLQPLADYELGRLRLRFGFTQPGLRLIGRALDAGLDDGVGALADLGDLVPEGHEMRTRLKAIKDRSDATEEDRREMLWLRIAGITELAAHRAGAAQRAKRTDSLRTGHPGPAIPIRRSRSKTCLAERGLLGLLRQSMKAELAVEDQRRAALAALARASILMAPKLPEAERRKRLAELDTRAVLDAGRARQDFEASLLARSREKHKTLETDATRNPLGAVAKGDFAEYRQTMSVVGEVVAALRFRETVEGFKEASKQPAGDGSKDGEAARRIVILQTVQRLGVEGEDKGPGRIQHETRTLTLAPTFKGQLIAGLSKDGAVSKMTWAETDVVVEWKGRPRVLRRIDASFTWARRGDPERWTLVGLRDLDLPGMGWRRLTLESAGLSVVREITRMRGLSIDGTPAEDRAGR